MTGRAATLLRVPPSARGGSHLAGMTDAVGLLEHADHAAPRIDHGYCVDDNARAVVVTERELDHHPALSPLFDRYLAFVLAAQAPDGRFHNRYVEAAGRWLDDAGTGDWWGRALWAVGHVVARRPRHRCADAARVAFLAGAAHRSHHLRPMAYAALGAAEVLGGAPTAIEAEVAATLLTDVVAVIGRPRSGVWPWPEPRLTYANARIPEALIAAGRALRDTTALHDGIALLEWLADVERHDNVMSFTPVGGWGIGQPRPAFDQQPIEAWAMAAAGLRAWHATGDPRWATLVERCRRWFVGGNDAGVVLVDTDTGAGHDGLMPRGRNENCGAESTLAWLATRRLADQASDLGPR